MREQAAETFSAACQPMSSTAESSPTPPDEAALEPAGPAAHAASTDDRWRAEVRAILAGAGWVLPIQVSSSLLAYVTQVAVARWMGVQEYGLYTYAYTWLVLLTVLACLGLDTAVLRFIPDYLRSRRWSELRGLLRVSEAMPFGAGLAIALLGTAAAIGLHLTSHPYAGTLVLALWAVPLQALAQIELGNCRAIGAPVLAYAPLFLGFRVLFLAGCFFIWRYVGALNSWNGIEMTAVALGLVVVGQRVLFRSMLPAEVGSSTASYQTATWTSVSSMMWLSAGLETLRSRSHIVVLGVMKPGADVGIYYAAERTAMLVELVLAALNALGSPKLAALYLQGERELSQRSLQRLAHWIFWPSLGGALLIWWSADFIFLLFGREFARARTATLALLAGELINVGTGPVRYLLNLTDNHLSVARVTAWVVLMGLALDLVLIARIGVTGAGIAGAASMALVNLWLYALTVKRLGVRPSIIDGILPLVRPSKHSEPAKSSSNC